MQKEVKIHSELIFVFVALFHFISFGIDAILTKLNLTNYYGLNFDLIEHIIYFSLLLLIWGFAKEWGLLGKRCLTTVISLTILNIVDSVHSLDNYYFYYKWILIINFCHFSYLLYKQWRK